MDQTPLPFEFLSGQTYNKIEENTLWIKGSKQSSWDKWQATLQLTVFADVIPRVRPLTLFRGLGIGSNIQIEQEMYNPRVVVKFNPTGYANSNDISEWIEEQVVPVLENKPTLMVFDLFGGHKREDVLDTMLAHDITLSLVPGSCTSLVQPLDVSINWPFKDILRETIDENLENLEKEQAKVLALGQKLQGSEVGMRRVMTTWAVGEGWEQFSIEKQNVVLMVFWVLGLSLPIDGSCDAEISIKGIETATVVEKLKNWGRLGEGTPNCDSTEIDEREDENEVINFEAGLLPPL